MHTQWKANINGPYSHCAIPRTMKVTPEAREGPWGPLSLPTPRLEVIGQCPSGRSHLHTEGTRCGHSYGMICLCVFIWELGGRPPESKNKKISNRAEYWAPTVDKGTFESSSTLNCTFTGKTGQECTSLVCAQAEEQEVGFVGRPLEW